MTNNYNKPWKIEYKRHWDYAVIDGKCIWTDCGDFIIGNGKKVVMKIIDCKDNTILETDSGYYGPDAKIAEYIVKCVNERVDEEELIL